MRRILELAILGMFALTAAAQTESLRGRLAAAEGNPPAIETAAHKHVTVAGEQESLEVLSDPRLADADIELLGRYDGPERFTVGPFYTSKSILVHKDGKRYTVSYWCPVCSIRTYTPGKCRCCRDETNMELEELKQ